MVDSYIQYDNSLSKYRLKDYLNWFTEGQPGPDRSSPGLLHTLLVVVVDDVHAVSRYRLN